MPLTGPNSNSEPRFVFDKAKAKKVMYKGNVNEHLPQHIIYIYVYMPHTRQCTISYHIISYVSYHIISYPTPYHNTSYHIIP